MKRDVKLGLRVSEELVRLGVETPMIEKGAKFDWLNKDLRTKKIEAHFKKIMELLQLDLSDDSLSGSPERVARMFATEMFSGLDYFNFPKITLIKNKMKYNEMLVEKEIAVKSTCEHHFVAIDGIATVAYIPKDEVIGLSKINRVVNFFSRRPQVQERLTEQIHAALTFLLKTEDVAVVIDAVHYCVRHRGIEDMNSRTSTSRLGGVFEFDPDARAEFLALSRVK